MRIMHNIASLNAHNKLKANNKTANSSLERLASGFRINRASDDAAGLSISEKMRGQIRGLSMAGKNIQDGISLIQTAEGALQEVHSILQRARELSVQAANDTNVTEDREALQKELSQLIQEVDDISEKTTFNTQKLLKVELPKISSPTIIDTVSNIKNFSYDLEKIKATKDGGYLAVVSNMGVKFNSDGNQLWAHSLGANKLVQEMIETSDKGYLVASYDATLTGNASISVSKLDNLQNPQWSTLISTEYIYEGIQLSEAADGTILLGALGSGIQNTDVILARLSTSGAILNSNALGTAYSTPYAYGNDAINGIVENPDGSIYLFGNNVLKNGGVYSNQKSWIAKVDENFNNIWEHLDGGLDSNDILGAINTDDGGIIAVGIFREDNTSQKGHIFKLNANGQKEWEQLLDESTVLGTVVKGENGEIIVGGDYNGATSLLVFDENGTHTNVVSLKDTQLSGAVDELIIDSNGRAIASTTTGKTAHFQIPDFSENVMKSKQLYIQTGANVDQSVSVILQDMSSKNLNIASINITNHQLAAKSISQLDQAINKVSDQRSNLGAIQNRLEHAQQMTSNTEENLQSAESRIRDTDMAKEIMNFTKQSILIQTSQAMLAQSNQQHNQVINLLN